MSGGSFHVHGPHDHELEHAAQHAAEGHHGVGGGSMTNQIALFTAVISTVGAIFAYMGGLTQADAMLYKNTAAIKKTEAANQWNYYQAKSSRQNLAELAATIPGVDAAKYTAAAERYKSEKEEIRKAAEKLEAESKEWDELSEVKLHQHHRWAQAMTAIQIAISLAAITLLTRKDWLKKISYTAAGASVVLGTLAAMHI